MVKWSNLGRLFVNETMIMNRITNGVALLALASIAFAAIQTTALAGKLPSVGGTISKLTPGQMQRLTKGELVFDVENPGHGDRRIRFAGVVNGSPDSVYRVLSGLDRYAQVLPAYFLESAIESREENSVVARFRFRTYWPFPDRFVLSRYVLSPERRTLTWWRVGGNVVKNDGVVVVQPYGSERSLVDFSVAVDPGIPFIPNWIFEWAERQVVPGVLAGLEKHLSERMADSN